MSGQIIPQRRTSSSTRTSIEIKLRQMADIKAADKCKKLVGRFFVAFFGKRCWPVFSEFAVENWSAVLQTLPRKPANLKSSARFRVGSSREGENGRGIHQKGWGGNRSIPWRMCLLQGRVQPDSCRGMPVVRQKARRCEAVPCRDSVLSTKMPPMPGTLSVTRPWPSALPTVRPAVS